MSHHVKELLEGESGLSIGHDNLLDIYPDAEVRIVREQYSILHVKKLCEERKELILNPDFQRNKVWGMKQRMELVESILMGIPIPVIYLFEMKDGTKQVVDGRQRIASILDFLNDRITLRNLNVLRNLKGSFKDLDPKLQGIFEDYQLFFYIIQPPTPERVKYDIFDRVNRGGTKLNSQEMRNALYHGKVTDLISEIAESKEFLMATDNGISPQRMRDRYVVLRALAFYLYYKRQLFDPDTLRPLEYKSDIDDFLAKTMIFLNKSLTDKMKDEYVALFKSTYGRISNALGTDAFRFVSLTGKKRPINMSLMEILTLVFLVNEWIEYRTDAAGLIMNLKLELDKSGLCTGNVDSSRSWNERLSMASKLID